MRAHQLHTEDHPSEIVLRRGATVVGLVEAPDSVEALGVLYLWQRAWCC